MNREARFVAVACLAAAVSMSSGCGASRPEPADSAAARDTLTAALDAWKAGRQPAALAEQTPPIQIKDLDWTGGFQLLGYRAEGEGKLVGYDMNYPVVLELKSPRGVSVRKTAVYTVTTSPNLLVARQEG